MRSLFVLAATFAAAASAYHHAEDDAAVSGVPVSPLTDAADVLDADASINLRVTPSQLRHMSSGDIRRALRALKRAGARVSRSQRRMLERAARKIMAKRSRRGRKRRSMRDPEGLIPDRTRTTRGRDGAASSTPSDKYDPRSASAYAAPGYGNPMAAPAGVRMPGTGWAGMGRTPGWYMPHTHPYSACDPAIQRDCPTPGAGHLGAHHFAAHPMAGYPVKVTPTGWWTFHPAFSHTGTSDPLPSHVPPQYHVGNVGHYWAPLAGHRGLVHAGSVDTRAAYYYPASAVEMSRAAQMQSQGSVSARGGNFGPGFGGFGGLPTTAGVVPGVDMRTAGTIAQSAYHAGPTAFSHPMQLGSTFMPPHVDTHPHHPHHDGSGMAPESPFGGAPTWAVLRATHPAGPSAIAASGGLSGTNALAGTDPASAPWLTSTDGKPTKSLEPGSALAPNRAGARVADHANQEKFTRTKQRTPRDKMAKNTNPNVPGEMPAPDDP